MAEKILCPIDGSGHAGVGLVAAARLAKLTGAQLTLCTVNVAQGGVRGPTINTWTEAEAQKLLSEGAAAAKNAGAPEVETVELVAREAGPAIVTYAEHSGTTHIVMGTGDKRGVKRLLLGSVASEVAGSARCSVMIAR
ncbi:MAG: universal stress protein [Paracoccaceae bacterium]